ncbi:MAG: hypothetical protein IPM35_12040 [Myxococcales bacterium]|nr:hypothetical protein [Myxococcales bacterium]
MSRLAWTALIAAACAGPAAQGSAGEIVIPPQRAPERGDEAPPPRAEPMPMGERDDPYLYFVGSWEGLVNDKLQTRLIVSDDGRFHIHLPVHQHRPTCDLWGKLRVAEKVVYFDIDKSTCEAESVGSTLERHVVTKTDDVLVVRAADSKMQIRYTRQQEP